jgi:hypothetical protein
MGEEVNFDAVAPPQLVPLWLDHEPFTVPTAQLIRTLCPMRATNANRGRDCTASAGGVRRFAMLYRRATGSAQEGLIHE